MFVRSKISYIRRSQCFFNSQTGNSINHDEIVEEFFNHHFKLNYQVIRDLSAKEVEIKNQIEKLENERNSVLMQRRELEKPIVEDKIVRDSIKAFEQLIIEVIATSIEQNKREIVRKRDWRFNDKLLEFFKPALTACGITFNKKIFIKDVEGTVENLYIQIPECIIFNDIFSAHKNGEYNNWLKNFVKKISLSSSNAQDKVEKDYGNLLNKLFLPIKNGETNAGFIKLTACPAAVEFFKNYAEVEGVKVSVHESIIVAEKDSGLRLNNRD